MNIKIRKNMKTVVALILTLLLTITLTACSSSKETSKTKETKTQYEPTEKDFEKLISGMEDRYVVQNAENIDLKALTTIDSSVITGLTVDDSKVDYTKTGTYKVTFTLTADASKLKKGEKGTVTSTFEKTITVVTPEDAQKLANEDKVVYNSNNQVVAKSDGTVTQETTTIVGNAQSGANVESAEKKATTNSSTKTNSSSSSNTNSSSSKPSSSSSSSSSNSNTSSSKPSTPAHSHSWTPVYKTVTVTPAYDETVVVTAAWDEPVYAKRYVCKRCGQQFKPEQEEELAMHCYNCGGIGSNYTLKNVQVSTTHHDAVTKVVHHNAVTKQEIDHYKCSCGATK